MRKKSKPASVELPAGTVLGGKYRLEGLIAEGGMSFVYAGRDVTLDERVALKVLKQEFQSEKDVLARFVREAKTVRRIESEHCVKILEVGMDPAHGPFMVMEYLQGLDLRAMLDAIGKLVPSRACELVVQVCEALAAAHAHDCIHRDIKPDNIFVLRRGELEDVRVLDFGISKHALTGSVLDQDLSLVNTISLMGTPMYMAPEQMRSKERHDWRTDIWSVGAMLYEMVTGRPPFVSDSITELCTMVLEAEAPPAAILEPEVPEALSDALQRCLRKNPDERFQNVGELAVALLPFVPRRARLSVERAVATLAAAGVNVDRDLVSQHPAPSTSAPPVFIPSAPRLPTGGPLLGQPPIATVPPSSAAPVARDVGPRSLPASRHAPTMPAVRVTERRRGIAAGVSLAVFALAIVALVGLRAVRTRRVEAGKVAAPLTVSVPPAPSAEPPPVVLVPPAPSPAPAPLPAPEEEPKAVAAAAAPSARTPHGVKKPLPHGTASAPRPAPSATTTSTSKVKLVDDTVPRPKVLD